MDGCENIPEVSLSTKKSREYAPQAWPDLVQVIYLANSLRSLQRLDGSFINEDLAQKLIAESADALDKAADKVPDDYVAIRLRLRAQCLRTGETKEAALDLAAGERDNLFVLCGPLVTWPGKTNAYLHSALIAMEDEEMTQNLRGLDRMLPEVKMYYEDALGLADLQIATVPLFTVTDLALCGGEANGFPKHFSYFLPENEGFKGQKDRKTVVFRNVYIERLRCLSIPFLEAIHGAVNEELKAQILDSRIALTWFRGHDLGHSWRHQLAAFKALRERIGQFHSFSLQEALSDVLGYLALLGPLRPAGLSNEEPIMFFYLSEMLRFISRREDIHPDLEASYLVLSFLIDGKYLEIDPYTCRLKVEAQRFNEGILQVARRLIHAVIGGNIDDAQTLAGHLGIVNGARQGTLAKVRQILSAQYKDIRYRITA